MDTLFTMDLFAKKAQEVIAEGCVLLRNHGRALPLEAGCRVAVFGRTQMNDYKSGLGSGGLVNTRYVTGIFAALKALGIYTMDETVRQAYEAWTEAHPFDMGDGWSNHPWYQQEMPLEETFVCGAAERNDAAVILLGRTAGEDRDNADEEGSWQLAQGEKAMLDVVCRCFSRTIVLLNTGNIIDMNWVEEYQPSAVMYVWQGGQEHGSGVAQVLSGRVNPSGRLTDTIAARVEDYPSAEGFGDPDRAVYAEDIYVGYRYFESFAQDKVLYPFGYGLSYTTFSHMPLSFGWDGKQAVLHHRVKNTGSVAGREVVQVYVQAPQGKLGKPDRVLCAFAKTGLLAPGESQDVEMIVPAQLLASYDDGGATGYRSCYVLEAGEYRFYAGKNVRRAEAAGHMLVEETRAVMQLEEACAPVEAFRRFHRAPDGTLTMEDAPLRRENPAHRRFERLPQSLPPVAEGTWKLADVAEGRCSLESFVGQMTDDDLCAIVRGEGMSSPRVTPGTAGAIGGVTQRLTDLFGLPTACCADGPSGIRMDCGNKAFSMPNGASQASTWNEELLKELYRLEGMEMRMYQVDALLGPGINIHRHPLNGRNFEYFSEDPLVTGKMAAAQLQGLDQSGVTGTIKHFACNNQEKRRTRVNAVVSERALREIYLKSFEIAVREGGAYTLMTSYNPLNSCWTASHYDLNTTILRHEWDFEGIVMTDWWAMGSEDGQEPSTTKVASMVRAQNDLFMVTNCAGENSGNDDSAESLRLGKVTRAEYQRSAMNICRYLMRTPAFQRKLGKQSLLDQQLEQMRSEDGDVVLEVPEFFVDEEAVLPGDRLDTGTGKSNLFQLRLSQRGVYRIKVTCRAGAQVPDTAQLPLSVSLDRMLLGMKVLSGADREWQTLVFDTMPIRRRLIFYLKLYFAMGGLEVKEVRVVRTRTLEGLSGGMP